MKIILSLVTSFVLMMGIFGVGEAGQNTLTWIDNSNNETNFNIERFVGTCGPVIFTPLATVGSNVTTYIDNAVVEGTTYCYKVNASNSAGTSTYSNMVSRTVPLSVPAPPSGLIVN